MKPTQSVLQTQKLRRGTGGRILLTGKIFREAMRTAWRTLQGFEIMNMLRKGQVHGVAKGDGKGQVARIARLFGVDA